MWPTDDDQNQTKSLVNAFERLFINEGLLTEDDLKKEFNFAVQIMDEWGLSPEERKLLFSGTPTADDGNLLMGLKEVLIEAVWQMHGKDLPEKEQDILQAKILRSRIPLLKNKTPLEFVNGNPENLAYLIDNAYAPK